MQACVQTGFLEDAPVCDMAMIEVGEMPEMKG